MTINHYFYLDAADGDSPSADTAHAHKGSSSDGDVQREIQLEMNRKRSQFRKGGADADDEDKDDDEGMKKVDFIPKGKRRLKSDPDAPEAGGGTTKSPYDDDDIQVSLNCNICNPFSGVHTLR